MSFLSMNTRGLHRVAGLALAGSLLMHGLVCSPVFGQSGLAANVVQAAVVGDAEEKLIREYVNPLLTGLKQAADQTMRSRDSLLSPLARGNTPSNAFRLRYGSIVASSLSDVLKTGTEMQQVNALVVAGELATSDALRVIAAGRESKLASVRYQAAAAAKRTIAVLSTITPPTIDRLAVGTMLKELSTQVTKEADSIVVDELLAALTQGLDLELNRDDAVKELAGAIAHVATKAGKKPAEAVLGQALLRSADKLSEVVTRGRGLSPEFHRSSAQIGAVLIAHGGRLAQAKAMAQSADDETRKLLVKLSGTAETLLLTAGDNLQRRPTQEGLAAKLGKGNAAGDAEFIEGAKRLIETAKGAPFSVPAAMMGME